MRALGITGAASVAGCLGDDSGDGNGSGNGDGNGTGNGDGNGTGNGDGNGDSGPTRVNYMRGGVLFTDLNWNNFSDNYNGTVAGYMMENGAFTRDDNTEVEPLGFSDFGYDPDSQEVSVTLRDDITYHNGDQYTAEDLWTWHEMLRLQAPDSSDYESIEQTDDLSVTFTTKETWNPDIARRQLISGMTFNFGARVWAEWLERYQDASDQDARDSISEELTNEFSISSQEFMDRGLGTAEWMMTEVTETYIDFRAYEDHYRFSGADDRFTGQYEPNVEYIRMFYADEQGRRDQFIVNERIDGIGHGHDWDTYKDVLPDYWELVLQEPLSRGSYSMKINWRNRPYLQDVNFRRAMAAAIDHELAAINTGYYAGPIDSGMGQGFNVSYWGEEAPDELIQYGVKADYDLMEDYLGQSDFSLDGNAVTGPDGEEHGPMRFVWGGGPWGENAQVAAAQLEQAGFPIERRPVDRSTKLDIIQDNETMTEWDLSTETHYAGITYHPSEFFKPDTFWGWRIGPGGFGGVSNFTEIVEGWLDEGLTHSPYNGKPMVFDIPAEFGSEEISGDTQTVNIYEDYNEAIQPITDERSQELIQKLSWAWNYMVPDIDITWSGFEFFGNTQKLEYAEEQQLMAWGTGTGGYSSGRVRLRSD